MQTVTLIHFSALGGQHTRPADVGWFFAHFHGTRRLSAKAKFCSLLKIPTHRSNSSQNFKQFITLPAA